MSEVETNGSGPGSGRGPFHEPRVKPPIRTSNTCSGCRELPFETPWLTVAEPLHLARQRHEPPVLDGMVHAERVRGQRGGHLRFNFTRCVRGGQPCPGAPDRSLEDEGHFAAGGGPS